MSRFTRFSGGKIWFDDIGTCKRFDICGVEGEPSDPPKPESQYGWQCQPRWYRPALASSNSLLEYRSGGERTGNEKQ